MLADLSDALHSDTIDSSERPSRRRKRSGAGFEDSETSKAVEAIRAAAKVALMSNEEDDNDGDDDIDDDGDDLSDDPGAEGGGKRRKLDDGGIAKRKPGAAGQAIPLTEEELRAKKRESNNVKKVKERQRRSKMSESIHELRRLLPQCRDDKKANQSIVMMRAVEYIKHLEGLLERALIENHKHRQSPGSGVAQMLPSDGVDPFHTPAPPPPVSHSPLSSTPVASEGRHVYTVAHLDHTVARAGKSSAFGPPPRVAPTLIVPLQAAQAPTVITTPSIEAAPPIQVHFGKSRLSLALPAATAALPVYEAPSSRTSSIQIASMDSLRSSGAHLDATVGEAAQKQPPRRASKAMKSYEAAQKQPQRPDWSSAASLSSQSAPQELPELPSLAGDIEDVGEWPLFFQRPFNPTDFGSENHISLDVSQGEDFGFGFGSYPAAEAQRAQDTVLDFNISSAIR